MYTSIGMGFDSLVQEYDKLTKEIEAKEFVSILY